MAGGERDLGLRILLQIAADFSPENRNRRLFRENSAKKTGPEVQIPPSPPASPSPRAPSVHMAEKRAGARYFQRHVAGENGRYQLPGRILPGLSPVRDLSVPGRRQYFIAPHSSGDRSAARETSALSPRWELLTKDSIVEPDRVARIPTHTLSWASSAI